MEFFDNVVNKSNAIIKERLNNPFGGSKQTDSQQPEQSGGANRGSQDGGTTATNETTTMQNDYTDNQTELRATTEKQFSHDSSNGAEFRTGEGDKNSQFAAIAADAEAVAQKAAKGAQKFGTFLFSMANKAGQTVSQTAKQVKQAVENTNILTDLTREQQEFVREHGGSMQAGELPWANEPDETKSAYIREQVLSLSQDKRNFVRAPPSDSNFNFDPQSCYPVALSLLKEDPNLNKMRYELVPKLVNEDTFWCNYFYRVSMLKQMSEKGTGAKKGWSSSRSSSGEGPDEVGSVDGHHTENEPLSPSYQTSTGRTPTSTTNTTSNAINFSNQQYNTEQKQESFSLVNTDNANVPEPSTRNDDSVDQREQQYQSNELESSASRKLVAEADDLKSKLRELNIGSFSLDGQDVIDEDRIEAELQRDLSEFELISRSDIREALDEELNEQSLNRR